VLFLTCLGAVVIVRESGFCAYLCDDWCCAREWRHAMLGVLADTGSKDGLALGNDYNALIVEVSARDSFSNGCTELLREIFSEVIVETA
jgi:hypothetical protein